MIKEYKSVYLQSAQLLPNYKTIPQMDLANGYLKNDHLQESYLSALILRYWNIISKISYKDKGLYDEKEVYDWYIDAVLYALRVHPWTNPESSVYNDPRAFEKIINTCINCSRANWFQASNRQKRRVNHGTSSYEELKEELNDSFVPESLITEMEYNSYKDTVVYYYERKQYLLALMVDVLVRDVKLEGKNNNKLLVSSIKKSIKSLPPKYCYYFSQHYGLDFEDVKKSLSYIFNMSDVKLRSVLDLYVYKLKDILKKEL